MHRFTKTSAETKPKVFSVHKTQAKIGLADDEQPGLQSIDHATPTRPFTLCRQATEIWLSRVVSFPQRSLPATQLLTIQQATFCFAECFIHGRRH